MSKLEQVAEAIYNHWANYPECSASKSWEELNKALPGQANDFRRKAKAAIEAMLVPTEEMVKAGTIMWDPMDGSPIRAAFDPLKPYQAMIKKALE